MPSRWIADQFIEHHACQDLQIAEQVVILAVAQNDSLFVLAMFRFQQSCTTHHYQTALLSRNYHYSLLTIIDHRPLFNTIHTESEKMHDPTS